jgi:hypothetical protein
MTTPVRPTDLTLRPPRIALEWFADILDDHGSPARGEAAPIWDLLIAGGVDPSFALGQFHVESLMGKSGYAAITRSWGNMYYDGQWTSTAGKYRPGNGATYAAYPTWRAGVVDYVAYLQRYATTVDVRYGGVTDTIDKATARWVGDPLDSPEHERYVRVLLSQINDEYEAGLGFVEVGDAVISVDLSNITTSKRYFVPNGTELCRGTDGDVIKLASFAGTGGLCRFLGPVGAKWTDTVWPWGAVIVGIKDVGLRVVYIANPKPALVTSV